MKREALLLIDIQNIYFTPGPLLLYKPIQTAKNARVLLDKFRMEGKAVIHVKHDFKILAEIHKIVKPLPNEKIICKKNPNSFLNTDLQKYLTVQGIEKLIVVGMMSHMCIDTTVRACQDYGYEVVVIEDGCTTQCLKYNGRKIDAETVHNAFMASIDGMFAKVMKLEEFIYEDKN